MTEMQETSVDRSTVLELLCSLVDTDPRRELVSDGVRRMSREQVLDEGLAVGRFLRSCGVAPDDGVVVILPNWAEFIAVRVAICACRSVIVPLVGNVQPDTLRVTLGEVRPACLITYGQEHYDMARSLGLSVEGARLGLTAVAALLAASAVSVAGLLGFVGLIVPHIVRLLVGSDYRYLIPGAAILGVATVTLSDTAARLILAPAELPVGIIMAFIGAPFFLFLLRKEV